MGTQADITQRMSRSSNKISQNLTGEGLIKQPDYVGLDDGERATDAEVAAKLRSNSQI